MNKLTKIMLFGLYLIPIGVTAMDSNDPIQQEKTIKITNIICKIFKHVTKLSPQCIDRFRYHLPDNDLEILEIICTTGEKKTILADQIPNDLKNKFNLAHQEYVQLVQHK